MRCMIAFETITSVKPLCGKSPKHIMYWMFFKLSSIVDLEILLLTLYCSVCCRLQNLSFLRVQAIFSFNESIVRRHFLVVVEFSNVALNKSSQVFCKWIATFGRKTKQLRKHHWRTFKYLKSVWLAVWFSYQYCIVLAWKRRLTMFGLQY